MTFHAHLGVRPGACDLYMRTNQAFEAQATVSDDTGPLDLSACTAKATVRDAAGTALLTMESTGGSPAITRNQRPNRRVVQVFRCIGTTRR